MSSPDPGTQVNYLFGVTPDGAGSAWTVGSYYSDYTNPATLTAHWSGNAWHVLPSPSPGNAAACGPNQSNQYSAVSAISPTDVWAVGYECVLNQKPLAAHWDGHHWTPTGVPTASGSFETVLTSVSALSPTDVWAAGFYQNRAAANVTLVEHWDGNAWSVVPSPNPSRASGAWLYGIAAISSTDVWAVGTYYSQATQYYNRVLVEHWDGTSWSIVSAPNPNLSCVLNAIAVASPDDIWAVGGGGAGNSGLVEHWNGTEWSAVTSPSPGTSVVTLTSVAVASGKAWSVGFASGGTATVEPYSQRWDGTKWSSMFTPELGAGGQLFGVAASGSSIYAVGAYALTLRYGALVNPLTLILQAQQ